MRIEILPGEGGQDAQAFAADLTSAVSRATGVTPERSGTTHVLHRL